MRNTKKVCNLHLITLENQVKSVEIIKKNVEKHIRNTKNPACGGPKFHPKV